MTVSLRSILAFVRSASVLLLMLTGLSLSSPIRSPENHHRASVSRGAGVNPLLDAQDFLSHFLSTINVTELRPQTRSLSAHEEPPEFMLELYDRFTHDSAAVPSANIVRSFKNEDSSPYSITAQGVRIYPLLFNVSMCHHEHIITAELHLFTQVQRAHRPHAGIDSKVTIYKTHEGTAWEKEAGNKGRRRGKGEVVEMKDLEELVTKHIHAKDNSWVSFDLTDVVRRWLKSGCATPRLEARVAVLRSEKVAQDGVPEAGRRLVEVDIDRSLEGKHNAVMVVFSEDQSGGQTLDKQELDQMIQHKNDLLGDMGWKRQPFGGRVNRNGDRANRGERGSLLELQPKLNYDAPSRMRRSVKREPCKRTPLFVDFKDIGWDTWVIQPLGYEAYECNGVCNPPMTSEVSPTKHAIVQSLLSVKSPERVSRACCVPTKLEPISLLYHENEAVTFKHKYEGMVVAECGCR
ncbi:bone morphogenetic protein 10-like [Brachionichthys hirsutus]|uniref:bone morphogenetic protein 10-like n=1 Tax=Brachionichthys hirsutus TaxID=412623 RepID=UPI003604D211